MQEVAFLRAEGALDRLEQVAARVKQLLASGDNAGAVEQATCAINLSSWFSLDVVPAARRALRVQTASFL